MRNLIRRKILPAALAVLMLAATPALAFAANTDGEIVPTTYEIVKTASSDTVVPGGEISYTIKVFIHGDPEEGILVPLAVQDALPEGLEYVEGSLSWKGEDGLATTPSFENGVLNAPLFTELQGDDTEKVVYPGQSITFTYRAKAAAELAAASDVMVVIGGRNSGNTRRLVEVCQASCPTYHVESAAELQPEWFAPHSRVGVTAGASTPQAHIDAVTAALEELA